MADLKKPLNRSALDALTLGTPEARTAFQEQRLALEIGRAIRQVRKAKDLTQTELAARAGVDQGDLSRLETGQGVRGATIAVVERVARALGQEIQIQLVTSDDDRADEAMTQQRDEVFSSR